MTSTHCIAPTGAKSRVRHPARIDISRANSFRCFFVVTLLFGGFASTVHAQTTTVSAQTTTASASRNDGGAETLDIGLFRFESVTGVVGGMLARLRRPSGMDDHLLIVWYSGEGPMGIAQDTPMILMHDGEIVRLPSFGQVRRSGATGAVSETIAYRMTADQLRRIAHSSRVQFRVESATGPLDLALTEENLQRARVFVVAILGGE